MPTDDPHDVFDPIPDRPTPFAKKLLFAIMYGWYPRIGDPCDMWDEEVVSKWV